MEEPLIANTNINKVEGPPTKKRGLLCWKCCGAHKSSECPHKDTIEGWPYRPVDLPSRELVCWKCGGNHKSSECPMKDVIEGWPYAPARGTTILDLTAYDIAHQYFIGVAPWSTGGFTLAMKTLDLRDHILFAIFPKNDPSIPLADDKRIICTVDSFATLNQTKKRFSGIYLKFSDPSELHKRFSLGVNELLWNVAADSNPTGLRFIIEVDPTNPNPTGGVYRLQWDAGLGHLN